MKCKKCNKKVNKIYEYRIDKGYIISGLCWSCYNALIDLDMRLAEIEEENEAVYVNEQCESQEEYEYKRENGWIV